MKNDLLAKVPLRVIAMPCAAIAIGHIFTPIRQSSNYPPPRIRFISRHGVRMLRAPEQQQAWDYIVAIEMRKRGDMGSQPKPGPLPADGIGYETSGSRSISLGEIWHSRGLRQVAARPADERLPSCESHWRRELKSRLGCGGRGDSRRAKLAMILCPGISKFDKVVIRARHRSREKLHECVTHA